MNFFCFTFFRFNYISFFKSNNFFRSRFDSFFFWSFDCFINNLRFFFSRLWFNFWFFFNNFFLNFNNLFNYYRNFFDFFNNLFFVSPYPLISARIPAVAFSISPIDCLAFSHSCCSRSPSSSPCFFIFSFASV